MPKPVVWMLIAGVAFAAYLIGAKAGRARYREISGAAKKVWNDPAVEKVRKRAYRKIEKVANQVADKIPG